MAILRKTQAKPLWIFGGCERCGGNLYKWDVDEKAYICITCSNIDYGDIPLHYTREKWYGKPTDDGEPELNMSEG